jgi:hypothetical protein
VIVMRRLLGVVVLGAVAVACGPDKPHAVPPKPPNNELIIGVFERRPPVGTTAARFRADGSVVIAHDHDKLDGPTIAEGHWDLDKDQLTLTYDKGACAKQGAGVYKVVVSKIGIRFTKVEDSCDERSQINGQTWFRAK